MTTKTTTVVVVDVGGGGRERGRGGRGGGGGGGGRGSATTTTIIDDDDAMHNSSGNGSGNVEAATTTTGPPSSGSGSPTYGMTPEQASREFDSLRREATKLERHLEDRVARYQQVRAGGRGVWCVALGELNREVRGFKSSASGPTYSYIVYIRRERKTKEKNTSGEERRREVRRAALHRKFDID